MFNYSHTIVTLISQVLLKLASGFKEAIQECYGQSTLSFHGKPSHYVPGQALRASEG
jgi:hypothetical protein